MQKIQGPFRVQHRDGRSWSILTLRDLTIHVWNMHISPNDLGLCSFKRQYPDNWRGERWSDRYPHLRVLYQRFDWIIRDSSDVPIPGWWIIARMSEAGYRWWTDQYWLRLTGEIRGRWDDTNRVPRYYGRRGSKRSRYSHRMRYPRTLSEMRDRITIEEELAEYDLSCPSWRELRTSYDDIPRANQRCWKKQRRTQYRVRSPRS